ncbi:hypothetical protein [Salinibacterium sp. SWN248]|uniref:hypothetical protein n=1 Tax=Salinibacterium sp. SWN248 TaxID=2792056 RepID=UPI0018CF71E3|nr:hypothetical protein [Salinibacterium sp. SWN248]MBH0023185.1 hypothetical protein [Salinibacterium sp. SWN248]
MYQNPGPGNYAHAQGRVFEVEAQIAAAEHGRGNIILEPDGPYRFRRGVLVTLLTIPLAAALAAIFGLASPTAGAATAPFAILIAFSLFARASDRFPVQEHGFGVAAGLGIVTMIIAAAISYPYSLFLTYLYDGGTGGILSSGFARFFATWVDANVVLIIISITIVTVVSVVILLRKARWARSFSVPD